MSWQSYVDQQLMNTNLFKNAAICGLDGQTWAKSEGFELMKDEVDQVLAGYKDLSLFYQKGVRLAGTRYIFLSSTGVDCRAKLNKDGVHIALVPKKCVIITTFSDPVQAGQVASVVGKLSDYLNSAVF